MSPPPKRPKRLLFDHNSYNADSHEDDEQLEPFANDQGDPMEGTSSRRRGFTSRWLKYFEISNGVAKCLVKNCAASFEARHSGNLGRHLKTAHPNLHAVETVEREREVEEPSVLEEKGRLANRLMKNLVLSITDHRTPFHQFDVNPLMTEEVRELAQARGIKWRLNAPNAKLLVQFAGRKLKNQLKKEMAGRFIHLEFDLATRQSRQFISINCTYFGTDKIAHRCLAVLERLQSNTGINLCLAIEEVLC